ncbi:PspA/IM30 family protein [Thalassobius sp. Cn5-15]|uniref:PspA/IM30 family protein n=1 Tax=Thalassobius sp. Cn5-15 TaxID=2917763 RepID=UPI001EF23476|nr:PspA/IM30 family protein [Thalassobius sp. Cn5-15]MCG7493349.1 PspA/IM30 family protein [Thalassobius sp. Cn5-15]
MFSTLKTLIQGTNARAEARLRDEHAIELIDQKIREAETGLKNAKFSLASLIQKQRGEAAQLTRIEGQIIDLTDRATGALADARDDLAGQAAEAIATLENEATLRRQTVNRLDAHVLQLQSAVERASRRILDLKQGAVAARAVRREQGAQRVLRRHIAQDSAFEEAEALIAQVLGADDPFEQAQILDDIDSGLKPDSALNTLADAGYGAAQQVTAAAVLARLKTA